MKNKYDVVMRRLHYYPMPWRVPIAEADIQDFERELGYPLPADYRTFLLDYGFTGCEPYVYYPNADDPRPAGGLSPFHGLMRGQPADLRTLRRVFAGRLPERLMAFAYSPGGQLCLSLHGEDAGCVYWWEQNAPLDDPDFPLILVAHDFDSFMHSLVRVEEPDNPPEPSEEAEANPPPAGRTPAGGGDVLRRADQTHLASGEIRPNSSEETVCDHGLDWSTDVGVRRIGYDAVFHGQ